MSPLEITIRRDSLSCVETSWWNQPAWQALALLHRTWTGSSTARQPHWHTGWPNSHGTGILCTFTGHQAQHHQGRAGNFTDRFWSPWHQGPRQTTVPGFSILSGEIQDSFYPKKKNPIKRELILCLTNLSQESTSTPPSLPLSLSLLTLSSS